MTDRDVRHREAARVLVLDPQGQVLLIHCWDVDDHDNMFWVTPGGGLDEGETYAEAAKREAFEELGLIVDDLGASVHERQTLLHFARIDYQQHEHYFVTRVDAPFDPSDKANWTDIEHDSILGFRWWDIEELRNTTERIFPEELVEVLESL